MRGMNGSGFQPEIRGKSGENSAPRFAFNLFARAYMILFTTTEMTISFQELRSAFVRFMARLCMNVCTPRVRAEPCISYCSICSNGRVACERERLSAYRVRQPAHCRVSRPSFPAACPVPAMRLANHALKNRLSCSSAICIVESGALFYCGFSRDIYDRRFRTAV